MKSNIAFIYFSEPTPCSVTTATINNILSQGAFVITVGELKRYKNFNNHIALETIDQLNSAFLKLEVHKVTHLHRLAHSETLIKSIQSFNDFLNLNDFNFLGEPKNSYSYNSYTFNDLITAKSAFDAWTLRMSTIQPICNTFFANKQRNTSHVFDSRFSLIYQYPMENYTPLPLFAQHLNLIKLENHFSVRGYSKHSNFIITKLDTLPQNITDIRSEKSANDYNITQKYAISKTTPWTNDNLAFGSSYNPAVIFLLHDSHQCILEIAKLFEKSTSIQYCGRPFQKNNNLSHNKFLRKMGLISCNLPIQLKDITTSWWNSIKVHHPNTSIYIFSYVPAEDWLSDEVLNTHFEKHADLILLQQQTNKVRKALLISKLKHESIESFKHAQTIELKNLDDHINNYLDII